MASVATKLVEEFDNSKSSDTFDRALYWYIRANNSAGVGIDAGIILATTALELLAKFVKQKGNDSNLLIVFYIQIMPDDFVMQLHRF